MKPAGVASLWIAEFAIAASLVPGCSGKTGDHAGAQGGFAGTGGQMAGSGGISGAGGASDAGMSGDAGVCSPNSTMDSP